MIKEGRHKQQRKAHSNRAIGMIFLNVWIIVILIYGFNQIQQKKIIQRFVTEYGFYGQSISLTEEMEYIHRYFGCSQSNGISKGTYEIAGDTLKLRIDRKDEFIFSEVYRITEIQLIPIDSGDVFTTVEQYGNW